MKIILKCEQPAYDQLTGRELSIERTVTHEFVADTLSEALENYEMFLRGIGYHFTGQLELVEDVDQMTDAEYETDTDDGQSVRVMNSMIRALMENDSHSTTTPTADQMLSRVVPSMVKFSKEEHCSVCGLSDIVMQNHNCWDDKCPRNASNNLAEKEM